MHRSSRERQSGDAEKTQKSCKTSAQKEQNLRAERAKILPARAKMSRAKEELETKLAGREQFWSWFFTGQVSLICLFQKPRNGIPCYGFMRSDHASRLMLLKAQGKACVLNRLFGQHVELLCGIAKRIFADHSEPYFSAR